MSKEESVEAPWENYTLWKIFFEFAHLENRLAGKLGARDEY